MHIFLCEFVVFKTTWKSGSVIVINLVYDAVLFSATIYKGKKSMMPNVFKYVKIFKLCSLFQPLPTFTFRKITIQIWLVLVHMLKHTVCGIFFTLGSHMIKKLRFFVFCDKCRFC